MRVLCLILTLATTAYAGNPIPNPGFEDGEKSWRLADLVSHAKAEAARSGGKGLRIEITKPQPRGSSAFSSRLPVEPGKEIELTFWVKSKKKLGGVYLHFYDSKGKYVKRGKSFPMAVMPNTGGEWKQQSLKTMPPEKAIAVAVWVHAWSSTTGVADLDDFSFAGLPEGAEPVRVEETPANRKAKPAPVPTIRSKPPIIIIKLDDLKQVRGRPHRRWVRIADYLASRKIKGGIGVICKTLQEAKPEYVKFIRKHRDSGIIEFWFHGWDHGVHTKDGVRYNEFKGRSPDEIKKRFADSQRLAQEKLGFAFTTFGPTGGVGNGLFDASTVQAVQEDPHIVGFLYPKPMDRVGKELEGRGKVTVLDRVWKVNLEAAVGSPSFDSFLRGYYRYNKREYFVLQGHPAAWSDARFKEFERIIDFLVKERAIFMTPTEFVKHKRGSK